MLSIVMLINRSGSMVLPFLGVYMTNELGFSIKEAGIVLSFYGIGSVIGSWLGGLLTDRLGEYHVQYVSLFLSAPLFMLIPVFPSVEGMAVVILIQSTIGETFRPANSVAITKYSNPQNLTRAFSLNRMAINLGFAIGPAMGGILSSVSYELLFISNTIGALLAGIFYVKFFKRRHKIFSKNMQRENTESVFHKKVSPYRDFPFLIFFVLCSLFSGCFFQFYNTMPIFYKEEVHLDQRSIGYMMGYSGIIIVALEMLIINFVDKRYRIAKIVFYGMFMCAVSYTMLAFNHHGLTLILSMTVLSIGEILVLPYLSTVTALRSDRGNQGAYMGLNGMSFSISFIFTPLLGTKVASDLGFDTLWIGSGVILTLVAIAMYFTVKWIIPKNAAAH